MSRYMRICAATFVVAAMCGLAPSAGATGGSKPEVIIEWNQLLQQNIGGAPFLQMRGYSMMHIAMADAVVAIEGRFDPFHAKVWAPRGASAEAAAAQAAHDVFVVLITTQAGRDAAAALLQSRLSKIPPGLRALGVNVGKKAATSILAWRLNDGYATANPQPPAYLASTLPGIWKATATGPFQFSEIGSVEPFGLLTVTQFLSVPFPQLESAEYADNVNEVKRVGRNTAPLTDRTEAQTRFAQLFASSGPYANPTTPFRLWSNVARDLALQKKLSLTSTARLFAMMFASMHDSVQSSQHAKSVYRLWRPETAIANADADDNPATDADNTWVPLITTPPYPAYPSNMTCIGTGASRMLANLLGGDAQTFSATWYTAANTVLWSEPYTSLWQLGNDEAWSRIWGGIHFRIDIDEAQASCTQVADYLYDNYMQPDRHHGW
ncbi:MAG TPA: vanadium-dependent haloperoxidase [Steroidobacteraceae bacterium]|nr:vanadium-dependent haloperoxidase [Steroidobacteraceae bacterium]